MGGYYYSILQTLLSSGLCNTSTSLSSRHLKLTMSNHTPRIPGKMWFTHQSSHLSQWSTFSHALMYLDCSLTCLFLKTHIHRKSCKFYFKFIIWSLPLLNSFAATVLVQTTPIFPVDNCISLPSGSPSSIFVPLQSTLTSVCFYNCSEIIEWFFEW